MDSFSAKKVILGIFFAMIISNASAESLIGTYWNFGNLGIGMNYSSKNDDNTEFTISVFNIAFEHKDTNIGIEFNPVKYWQLYKFQNEPETQENGVKYSFINTSIYWDLIGHHKVFLFGPFASINYLYINPSIGIDTKEYIFSGGLRFSLKNPYFEFSNAQVFNTEIGYRNIMGKNKFYCSINMDAILFLIAVGSNFPPHRYGGDYPSYGGLRCSTAGGM